MVRVMMLPNTMGRNTITVVRVDAVRAVATDFTPESIDDSELSFCPRRDSIIIILLSTTIPAPRARPLRLMTSIGMPAKYMQAKTVTRDTGIERLIAITGPAPL